ncbi:hypothetical protein B0T24DRAFT_705824 [Lasiosphaeria ovina]|uniref:Uncharacterized protein n=1 Tax=Lasiosphaeria ovina TaxID=92902 RepID=A0AAE0K7G3_9PEZI|nr:hypothetical protein B0T24DRAFT_705824 [Lasiosphaeria ovina]
MKFTSTLFGLAALLTSISASPVEVQPRAITSVDFSNFAVSCDDSICSYSTDNVLSDSTAFSCKHPTAGATIPANSRFWNCTAEDLALRMNKLPAPTSAYRIVLTDAPIPGSIFTAE